MKRRQRIHPPAYYLGRASRDNSQSRDAQPYDWLTVNCGWWLAGWHDCDMELSHEPKNPPIAATAQAA
ncbi:hypothetical protein QEL91_004803 [Pseudomonas putida]|nr:hypothetical protein [Pseudomonas putida]